VGKTSFSKIACRLLLYKNTGVCEAKTHWGNKKPDLGWLRSVFNSGRKRRREKSNKRVTIRGGPLVPIRIDVTRGGGGETDKFPRVWGLPYKLVKKLKQKQRVSHLKKRGNISGGDWVPTAQGEGRKDLKKLWKAFRDNLPKQEGEDWGKEAGRLHQTDAREITNRAPATPKKKDTLKRVGHNRVSDGALRRGEEENFLLRGDEKVCGCFLKVAGEGKGG